MSGWIPSLDALTPQLDSGLKSMQKASHRLCFTCQRGPVLKAAEHPACVYNESAAALGG